MATAILVVGLAGAALAQAAAALGWSPLDKGRSVGTVVGPLVPVTDMDRTANRANNSPKVVADPGDERFLALANRLDAPDYGCALHLSGDEGASWTPVKPVVDLPYGVQKCYGAEVAIDRKGRLYFLFVGLTGDGNLPVGVYLTTSSDRGRRFSPPRKVLDGHNFGVRMAIDTEAGDRGRVHLLWLRATSPPGLGSLGPPPNPILTAHSDDGGATFSEPLQVSDPKRDRVVAPALAIGPDRAVHVGYYDLGDDARDYQGLEGPVWEGTWSLVVSSSFDGGTTFGAGVVAEEAVVPEDRVMVIFTMPPPALVAGGKRVCLAWTDARNGDGDALMRCSPDRGRTWPGAPGRLNDDTMSSGAMQYLPQLAIAPGGRIDAIFYDRRDDPQNLNNDVSYTFSSDGGRRFSRNITLTTEGSSLSRIGQQYAVVSAADRHDFGARSALLSRDRDVIAAWTDTHNSLPPTTAQDIFTTRVSPAHRTGQGTGAAALVALGIAAAALAIAMVVGRRRRSARHVPPVDPIPSPHAAEGVIARTGA